MARQLASSGVDAELARIIATLLVLDESEITPGSSIVDDLGADSLDTIELVVLVEQHFHIEIPDDVAEDLDTVKKFQDYIEAHKH